MMQRFDEEKVLELFTLGNFRSGIAGKELHIPYLALMWPHTGLSVDLCQAGQRLRLSFLCCLASPLGIVGTSQGGRLLIFDYYLT
eukprot:m.36959 g.36959  ORF g.36959 m.36959 type:complete len:85 (-) comp9215_c0_seq2:11-265(-)